MTQDDFAKTFAGLCIAFNQEIKEERVRIYFDFLKTIDAEQFKSMGARAIATCKFFPTIAELLEMAGGNNDQLALDNWNEILRLRQESLRATSDSDRIKYNPQTGTIFMDPPEIKPGSLEEKLIRIFGGWHKFCESEIDGWMRKEWCENFKIYAKSGHQPALVGREQKALKGEGK